MSKKNQNFKNTPDIKFITTLLDTFGLTGLDDDRYFTKEHMEEIKAVENITKIIPQLKDYYLPCKAKNYITNITDKRCITILRQFIRIHGYTLISKERSIEGQKTIVYRLIEDNKESTPKKSETKKNIVISFE